MKIVRLQLGAMGTNCYLLEESGEVAIIDPGFEPDRILAEIRKLNSARDPDFTTRAPGMRNSEILPPRHEDTKNPKSGELTAKDTKNSGRGTRNSSPITVEYIINTHGHIDHMGANAEIKAATGAPILIGRRDAEQLTDAQSNLSAFLGGVVLSPKADRLLIEGDVVEIGGVNLRVIETPGHTEGGICLLGEGFAFTGDTLFFDSMGRTDFPGGSEEQILVSLKRLVELLPDDTMIYPGHNEPGRMGDAKRVNPFLDFAHWG